MDFSSYTKDISTLTLIVSCGCNLKCSYCEIAKSVNEDSARLQTETIQALENGTFLQNVKQTFQRLSINNEHIYSLDLWGQEPTLTLDKFTAHLEEWINFLPNIEKFFFSTNGMAYPERIVDLVLTFEKLWENKDKPLEFTLQFSYDGDLSTNNIRNAESTTIQKNLLYIINELNKYQINNIIFKPHVHGVVSLELLKLLDTPEKVLDYYNNMADWIEPFLDLSTNFNVKFDYSPSLSLEAPVDATSEDGWRLTRFAKWTQQLDRRKLHSDYINQTIKYLFSPPFATAFIAAACNEITIDDWVTRILQDRNYYDEATRFLSPNIFCGTNKFSIKIMYDGTLISCQNNIFDRDKRYATADTPELKSIKDSWVDHHLFINPIHDTDKQIETVLELFNTTQTTSWRFLIEHYIITMYWLARAGQIDVKYCENEYVLVKHALMLIKYNQCVYNNYIKTGSAFMRGNGWFRLFFNGYADVLEYEYNKTLSNDLERSKKFEQEKCAV